jgi:hypothetical protein
MNLEARSMFARTNIKLMTSVRQITGRASFLLSMNTSSKHLQTVFVEVTFSKCSLIETQAEWM